VHMESGAVNRSKACGNNSLRRNKREEKSSTRRRRNEETQGKGNSTISLGWPNCWGERKTYKSTRVDKVSANDANRNAISGKEKQCPLQMRRERRGGREKNRERVWE